MKKIKKNTKTPISIRFEPELLDALKQKSESMKRTSVTDLIEASVEHLLSLPGEEQDKILYNFMFGKSK